MFLLHKRCIYGDNESDRSIENVDREAAWRDPLQSSFNAFKDLEEWIKKERHENSYKCNQLSHILRDLNLRRPRFS